MAEKRGVKRKLVSHTIDFKLKLIAAVDKKDHSKSEICKEFNIANSTLSTFLRDRQKIEAAASSSTFQLQRKRMRVCCEKDRGREKIEEGLFVWFKQARASGLPVSGPIICEKAVSLAEELGVDFMPNTGWLARFKERKGITFRRVCGEAASVCDETVNEWKEQTLPDILSQYDPNDTFNCDETGLFYKCLPSKTLALKKDPCTGGKVAKDRITVLISTNMTGNEKMPLLVIGKSAKPRCFKNVKTLPVEYRNNKKSWMTTFLFNEWLLKLDRRMKMQQRKIVMFLDNCPAHGKPKLDNVRLVFMPPNTTAKLQPCDQGIIANFKQKYRSLVMQRLLVQFESQTEDKQEQFKFNLTLLDAMNIARTAWSHVTETTIANCFRHAGFGTPTETRPETERDDTDLHDNDPDLQAVFSQVQRVLPDCSEVTIADYVSVDSELQTTGEASVKDIAEMVKGIDKEEEEEEEDRDEEEDEEEELKPVTLSDARTAMKTLTNFLLTHCVDVTSLDLASSLEQEIEKCSSNEKKQMRILDFFKSK